MRKSKPLVIVSVRPPAVAEMGQADPFRRHHLDAFFTAVLALGLCPSVCLYLCLSVTSQCSTKTAKRRITQTTPHDSPGTLVF